jgi:regulator of replication initiation timing
MDDKKPLRSTYVGRAAEDTQRLLRDVMQENEKLQVLAGASERENERLQQQLGQATAELERHRREHDQLRRQLSDIERESRSFATQFAEIEQRNINLANLYVSSYQLHGTLDRGVVLDSIREIVINLIGCEEVAVFELSGDAATLDLVTSFGVDETAYRHVSVTEHPIGKLAATGDMYLGGTAADGGGAAVVGGAAAGEGEGTTVTACLPLKLDGRVTGAIVLFRLLPHKPALQELDFELFDLLGTHAATALYCTSLHQRVTGGMVA